MELQPLIGRYFRLKQELAIAYNAQPWHSGRIDRLANELSATEREIAALNRLAPARLDGITIPASSARGSGPEH